MIKKLYCVVEHVAGETRTIHHQSVVRRMLEKLRRLVHARVPVLLTCLFGEKNCAVQRELNQMMVVGYY